MNTKLFFSDIDKESDYFFFHINVYFFFPSHSLELNTKLEAIRGTSGKYILQFRRTVTVDDETLDLHSVGWTGFPWREAWVTA